MLNLSETEILHQDFKRFYELNRYYGILSVKKILNNEDKNATQTPSTPKLKRNFSEMSRNEQADATEEAKATLKMDIEKRGAEFTFFSLCELYADQIEHVVPELIQVPMRNIEISSSIVGLLISHSFCHLN
jgi:hypothetical protein